MSTARDVVPAGTTINLDGGAIATSNGDGTFTITGGTPDENGVWEPAPSPDAPGAEKIDGTGTQFDGTWWVKQ